MIPSLSIPQLSVTNVRSPPIDPLCSLPLLKDADWVIVHKDYSTEKAPPSPLQTKAAIVTICHIRSPLMNLTGCEIRFVLFGPDGRVTEWSLTAMRN